MDLSEGSRRSERIRIHRNRTRSFESTPPPERARVLFFLDARPASSRRRTTRRSMGHLHILSGPAFANRTLFLPMDLSSPFSMVQSVLLPGPRPLTPAPAYPQRIRYSSVSRWDPPFLRQFQGRNLEYGHEVRGVLLLALIVNPSLENLMRLNPTRGMSLLLDIAAYFLQ
ncbi:uncharacterized protein [Drosophila takahashii]|uniref:uncharacterized protein n=1 Tax=Drosophila takahashii TaxID=29030 RepID=UPI001CF8F5B3|nr:uncharacterized protein LOC108066030 [Drosophila takahashii]